MSSTSVSPPINQQQQFEGTPNSKSLDQSNVTSNIIDESSSDANDAGTSQREANNTIPFKEDVQIATVSTSAAVS